MIKKVRLEELCIPKSSNLAQKDILENNGIYPVYGASGFIKKINFYHQKNEYIAVVKDGAGIGRTMFLPANSSIIGTMQYLIPVEKIHPKFLYYAVKSMNLSKYFSGATIPHIYFKDYKNEMVPLYNIKDQQKISNFFEKLESIIEKKRNQLLEYDQLIKSRFFKMFFDENSKDKYPLCKWKEVVTIKHGKDYKNNLIKKGGYPIYGSGGFMGIYADKYLVEDFSTIIGRKGTIDKPLFVKEKFWNVDTAFGIEVNKAILNPIFFYYRSALYDLKKMSTSTTLPSMTQSALNIIEIGVPPIALQNEFALFVEQVDKLKFTVQKSLEETQTLFDSLMQKYFG